MVTKPGLTKDSPANIVSELSSTLNIGRVLPRFRGSGHTMTRTWDLTLISGFVSLGKVLYISREEHLALSSWEPHLDPLNAAVDRFRS